MLNENELAAIDASKTKMLKAIQKMERIVTQWYGGNLQREIQSLLLALEDGTDNEIVEAIAETVDGCGTAISELRDLNWALDSFDEATHDWQEALAASNQRLSKVFDDQ